ncbi:MAG: DNA double-strand break repair nuclease NurA [Cyanobacteria bacterium REEB459]|nr:DNA double-strand break repair nuclease NurA [Cyanobacteria bacterium REEB459]
MLDLVKLAQQLPDIGQHLSREAQAVQRRLAAAQTLWTAAVNRQADLVDQMHRHGDRLAFAVPQPHQPLASYPTVSPASPVHTVIATDGSQIAPSHHEIAYCYLINVGRVVLPYGQGCAPLLDSLPEVVFKSEDLAISRPWGIATEDWMGYRRTVAEALALADLGAVVSQRGRSSPMLALVDGSLIYWFLESLPEPARDLILGPILAAWEQLRQQQIPLVGYLSASRSAETMNFLRLAACPFAAPDCQQHCGASPDKAPCGRFLPLRDATFWATQLAPGQCSPFWRSGAPMVERYGDQAIYFCYLHVGSEVARLEMPAWVVADADRCQQVLAMVLAQVQKGYGYPVSLAEAHNLAVVRGSDRARFFLLLEQEMVRAGLTNIGASSKETRKRGSIA